MDVFPWKCPSCGHATTITKPNFALKTTDVWCEATQVGKALKMHSMLIECPNQQCRAQSFKVTVSHGAVSTDARYSRFVKIDEAAPAVVGAFSFLPATPQPLSAHIPVAVSADYSEAYLIRPLSPKASATLARRALQGMVRDFWRVSRPRLHDELVAIKEHCDPALYEAMMAVKSIGNIGAHPEHDVSLIVEIEPGEAEVLLDLLHVLDQEWYVARADRLARIERVKALSSDKQSARKPEEI
jgi:hypothetical protein